jgi:hypothetical protein
VAKRNPRAGSYFSAARMSPKQPSCTKSCKLTPRFWYRRAMDTTSRMLALSSSSLAARFAAWSTANCTATASAASRAEDAARARARCAAAASGSPPLPPFSPFSASSAAATAAAAARCSARYAGLAPVKLAATAHSSPDGSRPRVAAAARLASTWSPSAKHRAPSSSSWAAVSRGASPMRPIVQLSDSDALTALALLVPTNLGRPATVAPPSIAAVARAAPICVNLLSFARRPLGSTGTASAALLLLLASPRVAVEASPPAERGRRPARAGTPTCVGVLGAQPPAKRGQRRFQVTCRAPVLKPVVSTAAKAASKSACRLDTIRSSLLLGMTGRVPSSVLTHRGGS